MSKEITTRSPGNSATISPEQVEILRKTLFKDFSDDEIKFSLAVCTRTGLDPFVRQIHFTKRKNRKTGEDTIVITTGIDGFRLTANRSHAYAGSDDPVFKLDNKRPTEASATVYKMVQGVRCPFTATARWVEFYPGDGPDGFMWRKMPFVMLGKCAEAQALRKAFPAELSNIYSHEELAQEKNSGTLLSTKAAEVNRILDAADAGPDLEIEANDSLPEEPDFSTEAAAKGPEDLGEYVIQIGKKYVGKKLKEISKDTLASFVEWVDNNIENKNPQTREFLEKARAYLEGE